VVVVLVVVMLVVVVVLVHIKKVRLLFRELEQQLQFKLVVVVLKDLLVTLMDLHHILEHQ
tara:strand:+ start:1213 stop:1392 length:180 start_codon:yes stop_codon:yes gene_type:complete